MALILEWLAILGAAVFAGGALYISIIEHPARMKAGPTVALAEFRLSYSRAAPWQASAAAVCLIAGTLASLLTSERAWAAGGLVVGLVIPFTLTVILPTNRQLLDTKTTLRDDVSMSLLSKWGKLHGLRTILGTLGLLILVSKALLR